MSTTDCELVIQVVRYRISHWAVPDHLVSQRILMQVESLYNRGIKRLTSPDYTLQDGTTAAIPWSEKLQEFTIVLYYLDNRIKMELGQGRYTIPSDSSFDTNEGSCNSALIDIFPNGGKKKIAKILCNLCVHRLYAGPKEGHIAPPARRQKDIFSKPIPGFRFKKLAKAINWNRIKSIDLQKTITTSDTRTVMSCLNDVAFGDAAEEDAEPGLLKGLQLAQFTVQYLLCSQDVMKDKQNVIHDALKTFQKEEDILDLKIAKLRARNKAMKREISEMDRLADSYHMALKRLEPHLKNRARRERVVTLKDKLQEILSETSDVPDVHSHSDISDQEQRVKKLKSKLVTAKSHGESRNGARIEKSKSEGDVLSNSWTSASSKASIAGSNTGPSSEWSKPSANNSSKDNELHNKKSNHVTKTTLKHLSDDEDDGDDGMDAWRGSLNKENFRNPVLMEKGTTKDTLPLTSLSMTKPKMPVSVLVESSNEVGPENKMKSEKDNASSTVVVKTSSNSALKSQPLQDIEDGVSKAPVQIPFKAVSVNTTASTAGLSSTVMSVDSLSNTGMNKMASLDNPLPSNTIEVATSTSTTTNARPGLNTWAPSSSSSTMPFVKGKYGAQYLDDDDDDEEENHAAGSKGMLNKTVPVSSSTAISTKASVAKSGSYDVEAKAVYRDQDSILSAEEIEMQSKQASASTLKQLDLTISTAGDEISGQYHNDTFDTPDYKRDHYSDRDESLIYSDSKQWYSGNKAEAKHGQSAGRRPSFKGGGGGDDSNMNISADSDSMPHLRMLETSKPSSAMAISSTDAFISSADESSHFTRLTVATNVNKGDNGNHHKADSNNNTGDSSSMFTAIDISKSLVIDLDMPGFNDNHQDSSYNGGESSITMSQPNTFSTSRGTPYGFNNTASRFRKYDDFDIDDRDEMNLGTMTMNKADITNSHKKVDDDDLMMNISEEGSSSLNYTSTSYSAPPTREFHSDYDRNNFSPRPGDNEDDLVLMGTAKLNLKGNMGLAGDTMEKDSLAGTMESNFNGGDTNASIGGGVGENILQSNESLSFRGAHSNRGSGQGLRYGSTLDSDNGKNISYGSTPFDSNYSSNSSAFENSRQHNDHVDDNTFVSDPNNTMDSAEYQYQRQSVDRSEIVRTSVDSFVSTNELAWKLGRAPLDLIELAQAFEVHLSGIALNGSVRDRTVLADFEFLDIKSQKSSVVRIPITTSFQPLSFSAHLIFNQETETTLRDEIEEIGDSMTFQINFYSANDDKLIGQAVVELWVMIEDCCNIVRKEIDIYTVDMSSVIGTAVVDVKGYAILIKCSE